MKVKANKALRNGTGRTLPVAKKVPRKRHPSPGAWRRATAAAPSRHGWTALSRSCSRSVRRLDQLILEAMPNAVCAVKWSVPFYGLPGQGWIAALNSFKAHVKLLFFAGSALKPMAPAGKGHNAIDFHSNEELDEDKKQVKAWLRQAKKLPGWGRRHNELLV